MKFRFAAIWLCAACVFLFILQLLIPGFTNALQLTPAAYVQVWRLLTAVFLHASVVHLLYNMFALALFGSILEGIIGPRKVLLIFIISGICANIIAAFFYTSSLGASGAIFGVIGALVVLRPRMTVWAFNLPMPMFVAGIIWAAGDLLGAVAFFSGNPIDNTGNIAHLAGIALGAVYGLLIRKNFRPQATRRQQVYLDEQGMRRWEDYYLR